MKKVYQNISITAEDITKGRVLIHNKFFFTHLHEFDAAWTLHEDGTVLQSGALSPLDIIPQGSKTITVPFSKPDIKPGAEYWLRISFSLRQETDWADQGHEIAWEQMKIPFAVPEPPVIQNSNLPPLQVEEVGNTIKIQNEHISIEFDRTRGVISSLIYHSQPILANVDGLTGPELNVFRAYTDNDEDLAKSWYEADLDSLCHSVDKFEVDNSRAGLVIITTMLNHTCSNEAGFIHTSTYTIYGNGYIVVNNHIEPFGELPVLPKVGVHLAVSGALNNFQWYGCGPHENYPDRKTSAAVGLYQSTVADQYVPYVRPQETGNKEDVRWAALTNAEGEGLLIVALQPLSMTALHYTSHDLDAANHIHELTPRKDIIVCLDARQLGLGNGSCGPGVLEKYEVKPEPVIFGYLLRPYRPSMGNITELTRIKITTK